MPVARRRMPYRPGLAPGSCVAVVRTLRTRHRPSRPSCGVARPWWWTRNRRPAPGRGRSWKPASRRRPNRSRLGSALPSRSPERPTVPAVRSFGEPRRRRLPRRLSRPSLPQRNPLARNRHGWSPLVPRLRRRCPIPLRRRPSMRRESASRPLPSRSAVRSPNPLVRRPRPARRPRLVQGPRLAQSRPSVGNPSRSPPPRWPPPRLRSLPKPPWLQHPRRGPCRSPRGTPGSARPSSCRPRATIRRTRPRSDASRKRIGSPPHRTTAAVVPVVRSTRLPPPNVRPSSALRTSRPERRHAVVVVVVVRSG